LDDGLVHRCTFTNCTILERASLGISIWDLEGTAPRRRLEA